MAKPTNQRILEWLHQFDDSLQNAWDVPRECSIPGIADAIGVVRSALHNPIKDLQKSNLLLSKQAHVINGGSRKRTVHFITKKGREYCKNINKISNSSEIFGNPPNLIKLIGRDKELKIIIEKLNKNNLILISGIAGIGKTAIVRTLIENESEKGVSAKWYSANSLSSPKTMVETWLGIKKLSSNIEDLFSVIKLENNNQILVIDNYDTITPRFRNEVLELLEKLASPKIKIVIISRPPYPKNFRSYLDIGGLDNKSSEELLEGFSRPEIKSMIEYFDGHPLGLTMTKKDIPFEKIKKDIENYFDKEVLQTLDENILSTVHELAIQPEPIGVEFLSHKDHLADLDNLSLITYHEDKIQLQNLIKNIVISKLKINDKEKLHNKFTIYLSKFKSDDSRFLRLFHEVKSGIKCNQDWINTNAVDICMEFPSKSSALFHEKINENNTSGDFFWFASISECELGNGANARNLFSQARNLGISEDKVLMSSKLDCRILRLNGNIEKSEKTLINMPFSCELDRIKFLIGEVSRKIDDRIPNQKPKINSIKLLEELNLNSLTIDEKRSCLIAIAVIKHTFYLYNNELNDAYEIRREMSRLTSKDSDILKEMELKNAIINGKNVDITTESNLRNIGLICWMLEFGTTNKLELLSKFKLIIENNPELSERQAGRRALALFWTWTGILNESKRALAWAQAIGRWASSECYNASKSLQKKLQAWLKETGRA
tara:strand:- start:20976 stop:23132 length:2157 start_codon:yes stop_codon:yes gene_type:complete